MAPQHKQTPPTTKPSHILMTADAITGVWQYALELARALRPHEVEITLAVMGPPPTPPQLVEASAVTNLHLKHLSCALEWMPEPWADLERAGEWLMQLEQSVAPDLIHLNHYAFGALPWSAPVLITAHTDLVSQHEAGQCSTAKENRHPPSSLGLFAHLAPYQTMVSEGLQQAGLIIAPTHGMAKALCEHYGPFAHPPRIIPHARTAKPPLSTQAKRNFILAAANRAWLPEKNLKTLDIAAAHTAWPIFLAGATESGCGQGIKLQHLDCLGPLVDAALGNWMGLASIFVHPCSYEPFGLAVLEAGQAGCALVLADIPSLREVWRDAAIYVSPHDPRALASALRRLIADLPLRTKLGERARRQAMNYHPATMAERTLAAYCHLLSQTPEPLDLRS